MPQKKNPDLLELARSKSARILGDSLVLQVALKGLPLAYNKDLQETQEPLFDAAESMLALLPLAKRWMEAVEFDYSAMQEAAQSGFMNAWAAATYLVQRGVPFRLAHEQVGKAVQLCLERGCELQDLPLSELRELNASFDQDFYSNLSLASVLGMHDVEGGTAPARVQKAVASVKERIATLNGDLHAHA